MEGGVEQQRDLTPEEEYDEWLAYTHSEEYAIEQDDQDALAENVSRIGEMRERRDRRAGEQFEGSYSVEGEDVPGEGLTTEERDDLDALHENRARTRPKGWPHNIEYQRLAPEVWEQLSQKEQELYSLFESMQGETLKGSLQMLLKGKAPAAVRLMNKIADLNFELTQDRDTEFQTVKSGFILESGKVIGGNEIHQHAQIMAKELGVPASDIRMGKAGADQGQWQVHPIRITQWGESNRNITFTDIPTTKQIAALATELKGSQGKILLSDEVAEWDGGVTPNKAVDFTKLSESAAIDEAIAFARNIGKNKGKAKIKDLYDTEYQTVNIRGFKGKINKEWRPGKDNRFYKRFYADALPGVELFLRKNPARPQLKVPLTYSVVTANGKWIVKSAKTQKAAFEALKGWFDEHGRRKVGIC
jgi:hypothetical protein